MFGSVYHPTLSTLAHFDHLKGQLSLLIFHNFLNVFYLKSYLRVGLFVCWYVCACVCVYGQL